MLFNCRLHDFAQKPQLLHIHRSIFPVSQQTRFQYNAIDTALTAAGAKNVKAVKPFIDTTKIKLGEDGKLTGLDEQLKEVQKTEGYLFVEKQQKQQTFKGFQPGASGEVKPGTEVDTSKMTYSELAAYMAANPDVKID